MVLKLKRYYPNDSQVELHRKLIDGKILPATLSKELERRKHVIANSVKLEQIPNKNITPTTKSQYGYFKNIRDLGEKISSGVIARRPGRKQETNSLVEKMFPKFVSPKVFLQSTEKPTKLCSNNLQPPLLPLISQNSPDKFFAGQRSSFKVPPSLPINSDYLQAVTSMTNSSPVAEHLLPSNCARHERKASSSFRDQGTRSVDKFEGEEMTETESRNGLLIRRPPSIPNSLRNNC
ncbi:hypothetical protein EB796_007621 [Bugula neritina]|uniref:Uncharacterized protein n=1 Tax=Bugula neritina TaxID=10212 RepID=A0A7J7K625_BUGNE|nr:hypothetical protein EB796_007621 [Bugula neritina]